MARPRNNVMKLSQAIRYRVAQLLDDGQPYEVVRCDPDVERECVERDVVLHNNSLLRYQATPEFEEYRRSVRDYADDLERRRMAAFFVDQEAGSDNLARVANYELLRIVLGKLQAGDELEAKELASISGALASYNRNKIAAERDDAKREFDRQKAEYEARINALELQLAQSNGGKEAGLSEEALREIEEKAGLL